MFDNHDSKTNGEYTFFLSLRDHIKVIFDVGCRQDSEFVDFTGQVHYFDPVPAFVHSLSLCPNKNQSCFFNSFGLGKEEKTLYYYPNYQSFFDRVRSCGVSDDDNKVLYSIKTAENYMKQHGLETVDLVKIDTEGYELEVLQGFGDRLSRVGIVQFEYGGTYLDSHTRLKDVLDVLSSHGFHKFSYLTPEGKSPLSSWDDHYHYCNIVCIHKDSHFPF